jgi:hypothetical protein
VTDGEWAAVAVAAVLAGAGAGVLLTLPVWSRSGPRSFASRLLGVHAGLVSVVGVVAAAAAVRSWQIVGDDPGQHVAGLLQVSRIDGDDSLFALLVLAIGFGTCLAVAALSLAARFAASDDTGERIVACAVLALEICVGGYAVARVLGGSRGAATIAVALQLPLAMVALVSCWPPAHDPVGGPT